MEIIRIDFKKCNLSKYLALVHNGLKRENKIHAVNTNESQENKMTWANSVGLLMHDL